MPSYCAFLGHQPHLSIAELAAVVPGFDLTRVIDQSVAVFSCPNDIPDGTYETLGGTVFLAKQIISDDIDLTDVPQIAVNELSSVRGKIVFSLRCSGVAKKHIKELYRRIKDQLRNGGRTSRYIGSEKKAAFPIQLYDENILSGKKGCEIVILQDKNDLWVGRTIAAQDIEAYSKRDMEKPVRDTTVGLLPPKLAQVMLNFGVWLTEDESKPTKKKGKKPPVSVYDPFCGTGVIPMESMLRGCPTYASDLAKKAVTGCTKNIDWLRKEQKILKKDVPSIVWKHDVTTPLDQKDVLKDPPDVVVTETTLGPPLTKEPTQKDLKKIVKEAEELESAFLQSIRDSLPGTPIVCMWPVWNLKKDKVYLESIWEALDSAGYRATLPPGISPTVKNRLSLIYRRPGQIVGREIVLLEPTGGRR